MDTSPNLADLQMLSDLACFSVTSMDNYCILMQFFLAQACSSIICLVYSIIYMYIYNEL